ncbi:hypothetical protein ACIGO6_33495 [Streptomyces sp. NPDC053750]|uniref:hypothetical protein n=1 Tax=Streptomyces sp. NPDC053750 TaxID=3365714 RepID=UPI0037CFDC13
MPDLLHYEVLNDPASFQVSGTGTGGESAGEVYIVVSNRTASHIAWWEIKVDVPCGNNAFDLTSDAAAINARLERTYRAAHGGTPGIEWDGKAGVLTVSADGYGGLFPPGASLVLLLEGFPVSAKQGVVELLVSEMASDHGDIRERSVPLYVMKRAPKVPRNFRPKESLVAAGADVVLQWEGPDSLTYRIQGPDGLSGTVPQRKGAGWEWSPAAGEEPKRDATYTLVATSSSQQQPGYFLTTTVHLRSPEFESVTATTGVRSPWVEGTRGKGRIVFTAQGAEIHDQTDAPGTVSAAKADVEAVTAAWVRGRGDGAGWIQFPFDGIKVGHGGGSDLGTVTADKVSAAGGVNTPWVGDRDAGKGWIEFPQSGVNVRKDGGQAWGTVAGDTADLNGINTKWVQGRDSSAGWIDFPPAGLNVFQGGGNRQWGTAAAGKADLNDLVTRRAEVKGDLSVTGRVDAGGELHAAGKTVVGGGLHVNGESAFSGKVNANGHLSVRNGTDKWIMHTNDDLVAINDNLRVHGAFRSDS